MELSGVRMSWLTLEKKYESNFLDTSPNSPKKRTDQQSKKTDTNKRSRPKFRTHSRRSRRTICPTKRTGVAGVKPRCQAQVSSPGVKPRCQGQKKNAANRRAVATSQNYNITILRRQRSTPRLIVRQTVDLFTLNISAISDIVYFSP